MGAIISECGLYRYQLWRTVRLTEKKRSVLWIMLNPSTADASEDDPTIRRCISFTRDWDYSLLTVVNLFAYRATDPRELMGAIDPVGPSNNSAITAGAKKSDLIIAAWGVRGGLRGRDKVVRAMLSQYGLPLMHVLGLTKDGHPRHPLYMPKKSIPVAWS